MANYLLTIGILFVLHQLTHCHLFRQDYHFDEGAGGWLKFNPIPVTWDEAVLSCLNDEAMLASPLDKELVKALSAIMVCHEVTTTPMFTGISNVYANSEYQTIEGIPISNLCIPWNSPLYKENMLNQSCIAMKADGTLSAVSCSDPHPFACYKKAGIEQGKCGPVNNDGKLFRQDYYFDHRARGWLKFHPNPEGWKAAVLTCHNEGAILASPLDEDMSKALSAIMVDNRLTTSPMFTGISNIYESSVYQSMEGVPLADICISWSAEPDMVKLTSESNCITMNANGMVTAVSCTNRLPFACYRKTGIEQSKCGPVETGYEFNTRTGSCYKAHNRLATWPEAFKICAREGAHLAVVNSDIEAEVLLELAKKVCIIPPQEGVMTVNIGFRAWGEAAQRTWITIHGQSLNDAGYAKWFPGEPNNYMNNPEWCGSLMANSKKGDGILNDSTCSLYAYKFICEIDLNNKSSPNH